MTSLPDHADASCDGASLEDGGFDGSIIIQSPTSVWLRAALPAASSSAWRAPKTSDETRHGRN